MKKNIYFLLIGLYAALIAPVHGQTPAEQLAEYRTRTFWERLNRQHGFDAYQLEKAVPFIDADGNWSSSALQYANLPALIAQAQGHECQSLMDEISDMLDTREPEKINKKNTQKWKFGINTYFGKALIKTKQELAIKLKQYQALQQATFATPMTETPVFARATEREAPEAWVHPRLQAQFGEDATNVPTPEYIRPQSSTAQQLPVDLSQLTLDPVPAQSTPQVTAEETEGWGTTLGRGLGWAVGKTAQGLWWGTKEAAKATATGAQAAWSAKKERDTRLQHEAEQQAVLDEHRQEQEKLLTQRDLFMQQLEEQRNRELQAWQAREFEPSTVYQTLEAKWETLGTIEGRLDKLETTIDPINFAADREACRMMQRDVRKMYRRVETQMNAILTLHAKTYDELTPEEQDHVHAAHQYIQAATDTTNQAVDLIHSIEALVTKPAQVVAPAKKTTQSRDEIIAQAQRNIAELDATIGGLLLQQKTAGRLSLSEQNELQAAQEKRDRINTMLSKILDKAKPHVVLSDEELEARVRALQGFPPAYEEQRSMTGN